MDKALKFIYEVLNLTFTDKEIEDHKHKISITMDQDIITEKNTKTNNNPEDSYNLGNYYILKEKESDVVSIFWSNDFINKYITDPQDKKIINYIKQHGIQTELGNRLFVLYTELKFNTYKLEHKFEKSFNDYLISASDYDDK